MDRLLINSWHGRELLNWLHLKKKKRKGKGKKKEKKKKGKKKLESFIQFLLF